MALRLNLKQSVSPLVAQRMVLVGRVKMAQAIQMPESEWAQILADVERDPLFQELLTAQFEGRAIVRYKRFGRTQLSGQFYDTQDANVAGGSGQSPDALLAEKKHLLALIQRIGQGNFERHFLYREENRSVDEVAAACGVTVEEARQISDFVLDMSVNAEFYHPSALTTTAMARPTVIGQIVRNDDGAFSIAYFSPHLARGLYELNWEGVRLWQKGKKFDRQSAARVKKLVGLLELSNMRRGAFWRVVDYLLREQKPYLESRDLTKMSPVSLRKAAAALQFAPSTISRVLSLKSVLLPWGDEVLLTFLMPGQRKVVLQALEQVLSAAATRPTDQAIAKRLRDEFGLNVSRRTITACRHVLEKKDSRQAA